MDNLLKAIIAIRRNRRRVKRGGIAPEERKDFMALKAADQDI
jgi:hypothetical protein